MGSRKLLAAGMAAGLVLGVGLTVSSQATAEVRGDGTIRACYGSRTGKVWVPRAGRACVGGKEFVVNAAGQPGSAGPTGSAGPVGPQGAIGATGVAGPQGPKGDTGATGAAGPQGPKGDTGAAGPGFVNGGGSGFADIPNIGGSGFAIGLGASADGNCSVLGENRFNDAEVSLWLSRDGSGTDYKVIAPGTAQGDLIPLTVAGTQAHVLVRGGSSKGAFTLDLWIVTRNSTCTYEWRIDSST